MKAEFKTVDEYIAQQPPEFRDKLGIIRQTVRKTVPDAEEVISYQMPAFKYHGILCYFALFKDHYSLFVSPGTRQAFDHDLKLYKTTKSAIHFPLNSPVPVKLIAEIVRFTAITNLEKAEAKKSAKKK